MARSRKQSESLDFGSDSFLDIIANIVGILIILIVIAGVRMSQAPLISHDVSETMPVADSVGVPQEAEGLTAAPQLEIQEQEPPEPPQPPIDYAALQAEAEAALARLAQYRQEPEVTFSVQLGGRANFVEPADPKMAAEIAGLEQQLQAQRLQLEQNGLQLQQLVQTQSQLNSRRDQLQAQQTSLQAESQTVLQSQQKVTAQLAELMRQKANLAEQLVVVQREAKPAAAIQHTMVPMGKQVTGHEWHFEVRRGKVAFIPLDELMAQLHNKVERWADWIAKYDTHEGVVGPVEGFSMEYKVSRERKSLAEELSRGPGVFRVGLDRWELIPSQQDYAETLEQAIHPQSVFRSTLNRCSLDDTITLWVYPDSFGMYQELSKIAHQMGYRVAARPLPFDKRIGGSPHGSKSVSQ